MEIDVQALVQQVLDMAAGWALKVLGAVVVLLVGRIVARWARAAIRSGMDRAGADATLIPFVSGLAYYAMLGLVVVAVLGMVGVQTASLIAVFGAAGLAVGLALQGTLSNFAAGVMLLVFRPFKVGDFIDTGGAKGTVDAIGLFATTLHTPDNVRVIAPNSAVFGETITNYAANDTRRIDLVVGIDYADDIGKAMQTIYEVLSGDDRVLKDPAPIVAVSELGDSSVNLVVRPWCNREEYWPLRFDLTRALKERIEAAGCSFPFPQRDVHLFQESAAG